MADLDAVYREHAETVYRFLLAKTGSAELAEELSARLGRKVRLVEKNGGGRIELAFYGAEDREKLIDQLRKL